MLTDTEFFYEVWAEKIRSKSISPYVRVPEEVSFGILWGGMFYREVLYPHVSFAPPPPMQTFCLSSPSATHIFTAAAVQD